MIHASIFWQNNDFAAYIQQIWFWGRRNRHPYRGSEMKWLFCWENLRVRSWLLDMGHWFLVGIRWVCEKVVISLHTLRNAAVGASETDTPSKDQTWSGYFVKRIRLSDYKSSIGVVAWETMDFQWKVLMLHDTCNQFLKKWWFRCIHLIILLVGRQKSTSPSRIRNGVLVSSRELEGQTDRESLIRVIDFL